MISNAYAQAAGGGGGVDTLMGLMPIIIMFALLYFMMIRPQMKRAKEQKQMIEALQKGDEVIAMGVIGKIVKLNESYIGLEVANGTIIHVQRQAVTTLLPKGTFNDVAK
jgi:preprotein translocase subunit YajC